MTTKQRQCLECLLLYPTKKAAANAAGVSENTLKRYLADDEFQAAYTAAFNELVRDATKQAQRSLEPAISVLHEIMTDSEQSGGVRTQAARSILEYGLKFSEFTELAARLDDLEKKYNELQEGSEEF